MFKIGDILTGNDRDNPYGYTNKHALVKVVNIIKDNPGRDMEVEIIESLNKNVVPTSQIGKWYEVHSRYFNLVSEAKEIADEDIATDDDINFLIG